MRPLLPHTGSTRDEVHEHPVLHHAVKLTWNALSLSSLTGPPVIGYAIDLQKDVVPITNNLIYHGTYEQTILGYTMSTMLTLPEYSTESIHVVLTC